MNTKQEDEITTAGAQLSALQSKDSSGNANVGGNTAVGSRQHLALGHNNGYMMPRRESIGVVNVLGEALFSGRRTSLGFGGDMGDMGFGGERMGRRPSMDSVVDAAIQNLTNRRLSMMGSSTQPPMNTTSMNNTMGGGMGLPPLGSSMMGGGLGGMMGMGMQSQSMNGMGDPMGMNMNANGNRGMSSQMNEFLMNGLGLNSMIGSNNHSLGNNDGNSPINRASNSGVNSNMDNSTSMRQIKLQEQRMELQRRQKELEIQRQQLLSAMEERKQAMQQMQKTIERGALQNRQPETDRRHSLFGGALSAMPLTDHDHASAALLAERRGSFGGGVEASRLKLEQEWRRSNGMRDERRGSLDLLGAIAGATQEAEVHNNLMNKTGKPDMSQINSNGGVLRNQSNGSSSGQMVNVPRNFSVIEKPIPLGLPADKDWLTPLHCFVRLHCVEVFTATKADVAIPTKGKRKPIQIGQVGIRCPHCHNSESGALSRERGSVYYPTRYVYCCLRKT